MGRISAIWINPLKFIEAHDIPMKKTPNTPDYDSLMRFISPDIGNPLDIEKIVENYKEISRETEDIPVSPAQSDLMNKIIFPLKFAKFNFMIENYIGTISLCGIVAEMNSVLLYNVNDIKMNNEVMENSDQKRLYGDTFERLGQYRRVEVLKVYDVITDEVYSHFTTIRLIRNKYLHYYSQDYENIRQDAKNIYDLTIKVTKSLLGIRFNKGKLLLDEKFLRYLDNIGFLL